MNGSFFRVVKKGKWVGDKEAKESRDVLTVGGILKLAGVEGAVLPRDSCTRKGSHTSHAA